GAGWPSGATPPIGWPVAFRTNSGDARRTFRAPTREAPLAVSARCAPLVSTSSGAPSASNSRLLAIAPTSQPSCSAAACAVGAGSGSSLIAPVAPLSRRAFATRSVFGCMGSTLSSAHARETDRRGKGRGAAGRGPPADGLRRRAEGGARVAGERTVRRTGIADSDAHAHAPQAEARREGRRRQGAPAAPASHTGLQLRLREGGRLVWALHRDGRVGVPGGQPDEEEEHPRQLLLGGPRRPQGTASGGQEAREAPRGRRP